MTQEIGELVKRIAENAKNGSQGRFDRVPDQDDDGFDCYDIDCQWGTVATVYVYSNSPEQDPYAVLEANSKRIAAVPEMEALIEAQAAEIERLREQIRADAEALHEAGGWLAEYENTLSRDFHHSTNAYAAAKEARAALQENTND